MSDRDCPCIGCTPETGRAPGCHGSRCTRGWPEWQAQHEAAREARRQRKSDEAALDSLTIRRSAVMRKRRRSKYE